jgi:hypothetical protein
MGIKDIPLHDHKHGKYSQKAVDKRRRTDKAPVDQSHAAGGKSLGWKTTSIGVVKMSSLDRYLTKWTGRPYNLLMSQLSIDKSHKGRTLREEVREAFRGRHAKWTTDKQERIQRRKQ